MYKFGLKLWSTNTDYYLAAARRLYSQGIFDYIELYVVPDTLSALLHWKTLPIPYIIHCPHFAHKFNLADPAKRAYNTKIYQEVKAYADTLNARYIIFHGGVEHNIEETAKQLANLHDTRALIENKPYRAPLGEKEQCRGYSIEEISYVMQEVGCGLCLDIGHAICAANSLGKEPYSYLESFVALAPKMFHISGNDISSPVDRHLHINEGNYDYQRILSLMRHGEYISIETKKDSPHSLDDFAEDVADLKTQVSKENAL